MQIEEKFTKRKGTRRTADLVEVLAGTVRLSMPHQEASMSVEFSTTHGPGHDEQRTIAMHLTPLEALQLAEQLTAGARQVISQHLKDANRA